MKVYTKVVIDIATGEVLEEHSYEYEGPVALADFGGGDVSGAYEKLAEAYREAAKTQYKMYQEARQTVSPWVTAGTGAVQTLAGIAGLPVYIMPQPAPAPAARQEPGPGPFLDFIRRRRREPPPQPQPAPQPQVGFTQTLQQWPGYQFMLEQGLEALGRAAAARGMELSGAQLRGITDYAQNMALTGALGPYLNLLEFLSGEGLGAGTFTGQSAMQTGQAMGQANILAAQAALQGALAQQQAGQGFWGSLLSGLGTVAGAIMPYVAPAIGSALGGLGTGLGTVYQFGGAADLSNFLGAGFLQEGGPALPDRPYVVGESGPELFVPTRPGIVIPNYLVPWVVTGSLGAPPASALAQERLRALQDAAFMDLLRRRALEKTLFRYRQPSLAPREEE